MAGRSTGLLGKLEQLKTQYGEGCALGKLEVLRELAGRRLPRATDVQRLHEVLCFLRAYPDDPHLLARVEAMLDAFSTRPDLRRHRDALQDSGIAGTAIHFAFFPATAAWLARRWGEHLTIDWPQFDQQENLERLLPELVLPGEVAGIDNYDLDAREWIERFRGPDETDAAFLLLRLAQLPMSSYTLETRFEQLDIPLRLAPGADTPARTREKFRPAPISFASGPLRRPRRSVREQLARPPAVVRTPSPGESRRLLDLARGSMVTGQRDMDAFAYGDVSDVRLADTGDGMQFACIGLIPERRFVLECLYGFLILKNGVPVGYGSYLGLFSSVEIAFTVFDTFREGDAHDIYLRTLANAYHLLGYRAFSVDPYQLGRNNEDAIRSGAWWFYQKTGFEPREPVQQRLMRTELRRMRADPSRRSSAGTLRKLAQANLFLQLGRARDDVIGILPLENIGLQVTRYVAARFGHDRRRAEATCAREAAAVLGVRSLRGFSAGERLAWRRWGPLISILPGLERWTRDEKQALAAVVRAKGSRRESDFLRRFDAHQRLRRSIRRLALRDDV